MVNLWAEKCIEQHVRTVSRFDLEVSLSAAIPFFVCMPTDGIAVWPRLPGRHCDAVRFLSVRLSCSEGV